MDPYVYVKSCNLISFFGGGDFFNIGWCEEYKSNKKGKQKEVFFSKLFIYFLSLDINKYKLKIYITRFFPHKGVNLVAP